MQKSTEYRKAFQQDGKHKRTIQKLVLQMKALEDEKGIEEDTSDDDTAREAARTIKRRVLLWHYESPNSRFKEVLKDCRGEHESVANCLRDDS
jgi:hypothetical protein